MIKNFVEKFAVALLLAITFVALPVSAYTVQRGDTLTSIAKSHNLMVPELLQLNRKIYNPNLIFVGEELNLGEQLFGISIPDVIALYEDSLASKITSSATSFTLVRGTDKQSRSLGGYYGFVLDEGTSTEEFMTANCTATACTITTRGIDVQDGKTGVSALKFEHRRGASVKISNFPQLALITRVVRGQESTGSSTLKIGDGNSVSSTSKCFVVDNGDASSPKWCYDEASNKFLVYNDGVNSYDITSGGSGLSASTTRAIGITNSAIYVNASSTRGFDYDSNGALYLKDGTNSGIYFDSSGIAVERYDTYDWYGAHSFNSSVRASSTFQSTQPLTVFGTSTSSTLPRISTDYISATSTGNVTTTVTNNLQVNGDIGATGTNFAKTLIKAGQGSQAANTTGNQVVTHSLGFTPSLITIYANASGTGSGSDISISNGNATSASDETCTYLGHVSTAGAGTSASGQNASIVCLYDSGGSVYARATLDAVDTTTFTLNWVTNGANGTSRYYQWAVYR